jgi:LPS-assembly protein
VPVFYTPYLQFPLGDQRMSGLLVPSFGTLVKMASMYKRPTTLTLLPNYDLTLTPRYIGDRGLMLGSEFRHMTENTRSSLAPPVCCPTTTKPAEDVLVTNAEGRTYIADVPDQRWFIKARHDGLAERWESLVDISAVSDDQYFHDFSNSGIRAANTCAVTQTGAI